MRFKVWGKCYNIQGNKIFPYPLIFSQSYFEGDLRGISRLASLTVLASNILGCTPTL